MLSHVGQNLLMFDACLFICEYVRAKLLISVCGVFLYFTLCFKPLYFHLTFFLYQLYKGTYKLFSFLSTVLMLCIYKSLVTTCSMNGELLWS